MCVNTEKLSIFIDKDLWEKNIAHQQSKGMKRNILGLLCDPEFKINLVDMILEGEYKIAPPYVAEIPKDNGKIRKVYVNQPLDRFVLTQLNYVYMTIYKDWIHPNCVSYQKGIGVKDIIPKICNELTKQKDVSGYKVDISKYFDSVSKQVLGEMLDKIDTGSPFDKLIKDYYFDDTLIDENGNVVKKYKSMTQGCAISTFLANCILRDVDEVLSNLDIIYYRYSDDILMIGPDAEKGMEILKRMLSEKGLVLNPKKIEPIYPNQWFTFLGIRINGNKKSISEKSLKEFMKHIKEYTSGEPQSEKSLRQAIKKINGYLYMDYLNNPNAFGWAEYFFSIMNIEKDIIQIDQYIKDSLRAMYTGRKNIGGLGVNKVTDQIGVLRGKGKNVKTNLQKVDQEMLKKCGYMSMNMLYKHFHMSKNLYKATLTMS